MSFVHLHTHSEFSLLDGANRISDLIRRAQEFEMPALALTDHGSLFGAWTFQKTAYKEGIKPIIGMEAYVAPGDRRERVRAGQGERAYYHLVLLARDLEGYHNLVKLASIGYTEGFYMRPRVDREVLARHSKGLIVSSACMAGEVARHILADNPAGAREAAEWYANTFPDRYYLEVQAHRTEGQDKVNREVFRLSEELGLPVVATNDAHFLQHEDHEAHDVLLCIGLGKDRNDENRMRYDDGLYFKSAQEVAEFFPDHPEVLENTLKIADEVDLKLKKQIHLPEFPLPEEYKDPNDYLVHLATKGAKERYGDPLSQEVRERLEDELNVILKTGYAGYFLITWDFIDWARRQGIPVGPGRGSAAGSLVAYALGITNIDPLEFDLLFERFLNPERISMPDIDIDFCFERRGEVISYTREKYGRDAVGQIITFGTMKSRAVIRDVGRTLGFEPSETDKIAKLIPNAPGQALTVEEALKKIPEVKALYKQDQRHKQLFDYSMTLEGLARHASVHAAGVVIAPGPLDDYVPVCVQQTKGSGASGIAGAGAAKNGNGNGASGNGDEGIVVTQYDMNCLDEVGMLKMDFLGLKTLTVIHDAVEAVKARLGSLKHPETGDVYETMDDVPLEDPAVYAMLAHGGTSGIFQFESNLALDKLRAMKCDRFEDLVATNALIRPGPLDSGMTDIYIRRKLGREPVRYPHPKLESVLEPTYGIIVYQEQVMRIASVLAGFSLGEADVLRKAVGKKIAELIQKELGKFKEKAIARGVDKRTADDLADQIETFGRYGFNKCLPGDSKILDADSGELVRIEDIHSGKKQVQRVLSCDPQTLRLEPASVADVMDNGIRQVFRLTTESGREIQATGNHPFLTFDGWTNLSALEAGMHVAVPRDLPISGSVQWPHHEVIALGHLLAEGNLCHPHSVYFYSQDPDEVADFIGAAEAFPNVRCTVADHKGTASVYAARINRKEPPGIFTWAGKLGLLGKTATEKEIPAEAFALGPDQIALLLSRMWAGDGHINLQGRSLFYATSAKTLAHQVQHLLARLGIISRIRTVSFPYRGSQRIGFQVFVTGQENLKRFADTVGVQFATERRRTAIFVLAEEAVVSEAVKDLIPVTVRDHVRQLKDKGRLTWKEVEAGAGVSSRDFYPVGTNPGKIGFTRKMIGSLGVFFKDQRLCDLAESHVLWDRVVSIEPAGETRTYDLEVPGHHNFVADDFIVHNSHSAAYSLLSYHTAWLKAHYPAEFMAALLSSVLDKTDDVVKYIGECRELHKHLPGVSEPLEVLPPDVNESGWKFTVVDEHQIRFGLGAVRGVGSGAVASIIQAREEKGSFKTLFDFLERIDLRLLNKRAAEALIAAGALDAFGHRGQLLAGLDVAYSEVQARQAEEAAGQASLFGGADAVLRRPDPALPEVPEWSESDRLTREKEALGFFISGHPLDRFRSVVEAFAPVNTSTLKSHLGQPVELACVVTQVTRQISRRDSSEWAKLLVEDFAGTATVLAFKDSWQEAKELLQQDAVVLIRGKVSGRERDEDDPPVFLDGAELLETVPASGKLAVQIELEFGGMPGEKAFAEAKKVMNQHPGVAPVEVLVQTGNGLGAPRLRSRTLRVDPGKETLQALEKLFGPSHVRLVKTITD